MAGERWYVACSLQRQEAKAELYLLRQGFRAFSPRMTKTVGRARKLRGAAFPSYMFVLLGLDRDLWRSINGTFGVASLMARERPRAGPFGVVEQLLDCAGDDGLLRFDRDLREGQVVRVVAGPFASAVGCLERLNATGRVRVLLDIMAAKCLRFWIDLRSRRGGVKLVAAF